MPDVSLYPKLSAELDAADTPQNNAHPSNNNVAPLQHDQTQPKVPLPALQQRKCRDILFLILFCLFWVGMAVVAGVAIRKGNLNRLKYGNDTEGNLCGVNNVQRDLSARPFLYIFNPLNDDSYRICLNNCPSESKQLLCKYDVVADDSNSTAVELQLIAGGNCTWTYASKPVLNRCIPHIFTFDGNATESNTSSSSSSSETIANTYFKAQSLATQILHDLYESWKVILICTVTAAVLSFLWICLLPWVGGPIVWFTIITATLASLGCTAYIWWSWNVVRKANSDESQINRYIPTSIQNEKTLLVAGIVSAVVSFLILLLVISLRKRIKLAIKLIGTTSQAVKSLPGIFVLPIFKYVLLSILIAWTLFIWALLATSGEVVVHELNSKSQEHFSKTFEPDNTLHFLEIYYALGFFWTFNLLVAIIQCSIAGSIATWYFTRDKKALPSLTVTKAFGRTLRYHLGSLAFGSLIIAIVQTIRAIIAYVQNRVKQIKNNQLLACLMCCLQCCFACLENFLKFLTKNAYIEIAIFGYSFCTASRIAFEVLVKNSIRLIVVDKTSDFIFFLGKLLVTMITTIIGNYLLQSSVLVDSADDARFWSFPLIIIGVLAYIIASFFVTVFDTAISTIFLCFCEDSERNDGSAEKPYYMGDDLKQFIDVKGKMKANLPTS